MLRMQSPKREAAPLAQPPALIYAAALTCGVLASLALQLYLRGAGFELATLWENMFATGTRQLRTTGPWWAIAGLAFLAGGITAAALSRLPLPWRRFRLLRWAAGAAIVFVLAQIADPRAWPPVHRTGPPWHDAVHSGDHRRHAADVRNDGRVGAVLDVRRQSRAARRAVALHHGRRDFARVSDAGLPPSALRSLDDLRRRLCARLSDLRGPVHLCRARESIGPAAMAERHEYKHGAHAAPG